MIDCVWPHAAKPLVSGGNQARDVAIFAVDTALAAELRAHGAPNRRCRTLRQGFETPGGLGDTVFTATLYRWWDTKEALIFDACCEHVEAAQSYDRQGSPLARLRRRIMGRADYLRTRQAKVMARLITAIYGNAKLQRTFLDRFYLPRRQANVELIKEAIACGELRADTNPELLVDALHGPMFFRWLQGHATVDRKFARALLDTVIRAFAP